MNTTPEPEENPASAQIERTSALPTISTAPAPKARWFASPTVNLISLIVGGLGLIGTFVAFFLAEQKPDLTYVQQPVRTIIVRTEDLSRLGVTYNGKPVTSDITAAQIAVWNNGNRSIRSDDVLQPIILQTNEQTPILDAKVRYVTRDIIGFQVKTDGAKPGELGLNFRILEPGDGAIVQLIYAGSPEIDVSLSGILVGQKKIRRTSILDTTVCEEYAPVSNSKRFTLFSAIFGSVVLLLSAMTANMLIGAAKLFRNPEGPENRRRTRKVVVILLSGLILGCVGFIIWVFLKLMRYTIGPPFSF